MIITLKIECVWGAYLREQCIRVFEFEEDAVLLDLHNAIQDAFDFGRDHPFRFYTANSSSPGAKIHWLEHSQAWDDIESEYACITLRDIYPLGRQKLYYLFDLGDKWTFEIRKTRGSKKPEVGVSYPRVVEALGPAPKQYPNWELTI